ncbi:hypothetical protein QTP88_001847 [Uroleucon formosanum]
MAKGPLSGPPSKVFKTISINIEGISDSKEELLAEMCKSTACDVLCIQETHRAAQDKRPTISGMQSVIERPHVKYGSAIFVRPDLNIISANLSEEMDIEILTIEIQNCTITSIYKPPTIPFAFNDPGNFNNQRTQIVVGDFNSHSTTWGYKENDENGDLVESWAEAWLLTLIHDPKLPPSFNSGRWKRGYNPDLIFVSNALKQQAIKRVERHIPRSQHSPISCEITHKIRANTTAFRRRFNFQKANWLDYSISLDIEISRLTATSITSELSEQFQTYSDRYENDPFNLDTIKEGERLLENITEVRRTNWHTLLNNVDMKHSSSKAWGLIKKLDCDPSKPKTRISAVTANQVAHQLLINGRTNIKKEKKKNHRYISDGKQCEGESILRDYFSPLELQTAIDELKNKKAAGVDDICTEQIKNLGPIAKKWLLDLFNNIKNTEQIPKIWRKSKIIALLKPGKTPDDPKNFRPISLLCHTYKLYEKLILNRLKIFIDDKLIKEQGGFRPGRSCTGQILGLTQHIENGYEKKKITGVVFIDLTAAYDTVNHNLLISKIKDLTKDNTLARTINTLLRNRRYCVELEGKVSRWRIQKNGLPQGSVLAPTLFNIYTNDQPILTQAGIKHFIYADDTALAAQGDTFQDVESTLEESLRVLSDYYDENFLKPNPSKTQVCAFHLKNREADRTLEIKWRDTKLNNSAHPTYLGVMLDRSLTYKHHCEKTKLKIATRNNILRKLTGSTWGANAHTLRVSALSLCFSAGEYASPVWSRSVHTKQIDTILNESCRLVTGCLKSTPLPKIYQLAGIAPPNIRREVAADWERTKAETDIRYPLHNQTTPNF